MRAWMLGVLVAAFLSGCATTSMKGTPFYTGEYDRREGPAADRVNLWPLLYYRDPALSVLWPIMEFSPDHLAVRPLYSVYGRSSETPVHNVVWPLARFDTKSGDHRVFPVYWGNDYFAAFPLYWHKGHPLSGRGYDSLFPLWIYRNSGSGSTAHVFWPLYARYDHAHHQGWRLWPFYGTNNRLDDQNRWWLASLAYAFEGDGDRGHGFFPFYGYASNSTHTAFYSLPYSRKIAREPGAKSWELALPLRYRGWVGATNTWGAIPLVSWGKNAPGMKDNRYAAGIVRSASTADSRSHHVLPFYYSERTADTERFYSLPWWSEHRADGTGWNASFPFFYGGWSTNSSVAVTPLYARKKLADGSEAWSCYVPAVYFDRTKDAHFMTLLGGAWRDGDEKRWVALPILSGGRSDAESGETVWLAKLAGRQWGPEGRSHHVFPLYYSAPEKKRFESLLYATRPVGDNQQYEFPILLSGWRTGEDYRLKFGLLGLWLSETRAGETTKSRLLPFYTWQRNDYFYTALYGHNDKMEYYFTPLAGSYAGDKSGSWIWPAYRHRVEADGDVDGRYLLLGTYAKDHDSRRHRFWGIYRFREWAWTSMRKEDADITRRKHWDYLLLGRHHDDRVFEKTPEGEAGELKRRRIGKGFWPLYASKVRDDLEKDKRENTSSLLLALYDTRREQQPGHDYLRRRVLWRLWHYEKLNGDSSTDVFPGITVDRYDSGYFKCSLFWRLFRYENNPETGKKEMDLLFVPLKR
ncbi:hypothetical protein [Pontiella sp.]|uniref:hypothetical protein n=1 Tax=Pontiella sp. TaxID=2837462 RepID=UPI003564622C